MRRRESIMNQAPSHPARDERQLLIKRLIDVGIPTDEDLDRAVGLDQCDVLVDGSHLVDRRVELGFSAQDIATLALSGQITEEVRAALDSIPPAGRHARGIG
jgi:hypothetical protein